MGTHKFEATVLREYDVRGIVGESLTADDAYHLGRAFGTRVARRGGARVCTGYDGRLSSPELEEALCDGLKRAGLDVVRIGLGPTPMLYYAVYQMDSDGGIMVTGSHNPPDYNGFKMMLGKAACFGEEIQALGALAAKGDYERGTGKAVNEDISGAYIERLLRDYDGPEISAAWDTGNGAASNIVRQLVGELPGRHMTIHDEVDGTFPNHHPDPTVEENLDDLKGLVTENGLDLGLGFDGDGDRIGAVDARARVVWGDQILAVLAADVLRDVPGATIIADVKASQVLFDEIARLGGKPEMWKTGHSLIKARMAELGAPLAGEMSGHIFFGHRYYGFDDAIFAALRLLQAIGRAGEGLAELKDAFPPVCNTPEIRFPCPEERKFAVVEEVRARLEATGTEMSAVDGVRVAAEGGWWLLRASNTQPVLVARCEGPDEEALGRLVDGLVDQLKKSNVEPPKNILYS